MLNLGDCAGGGCGTGITMDTESPTANYSRFKWCDLKPFLLIVFGVACVRVRPEQVTLILGLICGADVLPNWLIGSGQTTKMSARACCWWQRPLEIMGHSSVRILHMQSVQSCA